MSTPLCGRLFMFMYLIVGFSFIGPFAETVQHWERTLSLVAETIDEWTDTQRKWLYLEGIFVMGDARTMLPDVAKAFDIVDSEFRKVSSVFFISAVALTQLIIHFF